MMASTMYSRKTTKASMTRAMTRFGTSAKTKPAAPGTGAGAAGAAQPATGGGGGGGGAASGIGGGDSGVAGGVGCCSSIGILSLIRDRASSHGHSDRRQHTPRKRLDSGASGTRL